MPRKRIRNEKVLAKVREQNCAACGGYPSEAHHVTTKAGLGGDVENNIMPLCHQCHIYGWHLKGRTYMVNNYPGVKEWLIENGRDDILGKIEFNERFKKNNQ